ncbi:MAG: 3-hydroxyacyl-[acyl-carrier-protein] dehydratase [Planctomycetota bacterium]|jgi:3-hydroxyacyl-[acyl-carrier-protein] dehydratase
MSTTSPNSEPKSVGERERIEALLPHRDPFLFVDRILEESDSRVLTEWYIAPELDCFRGHYPGQPLLPGVLISEFVFQTGALLIYLGSKDDRDHEGTPVMTRIEDARFKRMVLPGDTLRAEVKLEERLANARYLSGKVTRDGKLVARLRFVLAVAPPESESGSQG